ncbi:MAG: hypothetical protein PHR45_03670 [Muribaculaceae bacterium]|nr:hypothetical protein [Muribaculaceae bacterium]
MKHLAFLFLLCASIFVVNATNYSREECQGSLRPYPSPRVAYDYPDSLRPVFINHIGRHGSRYPASSASALLLRNALLRADSLNTITPLGRRFAVVVEDVISKSNNRWGALDSLGMAEQRGIASRMFINFPEVFKNANIEAVATHSPRVVMSMYSFTHQLTELSSSVNITAGEGKRYNYLLRPFDVDTAYISYIRHGEWRKIYNEQFNKDCPVGAIRRLLGDKFKAGDEELRNLAINEYYLIAGMSAMQIDFDYKPYLSIEEYNKLWSFFNLRQYLQRTATVASTIPAEIASPLLEEMIMTADSVANGLLNLGAKLRFAHAETLMPLLSLMCIPQCNYLTHYYDTVASNWKDFNVVPMASNLQMIFFRAPSGEIYVRTDFNEAPVAVIHGNSEIYLKWNELRNYLLQFCI